MLKLILRWLRREVEAHKHDQEIHERCMRLMQGGTVRPMGMRRDRF